MLDLAAGTGKLTRQLVSRVARVIAVEPLDGMRAVLERVVPEAEAISGTADAIPLADDAVDAVFVGEAFHWFATAATLAELARVLRPGGTLAILFNQADGDFEPPLPEAFWEAYRAAAIEKPPEQTVRTGLWQAPFPGPFEPFVESSFPNPIELDGSRFWRRPRRGAWSARFRSRTARRSSRGWASSSPRGSTGIRCARTCTALGSRGASCRFGQLDARRRSARLPRSS